MAGTFTIDGAPKIKIPRQSARLRVESLVYLDLGPENGGFPLNISEEGMAFQGIQPLQKDEEIRISFKLDGINEPVTATARVVWLTESRKAGALRFIDLPEDSRSRIRQWIEMQGKAESPQHSAEMNISRGKPRLQPKPKEAAPIPVVPATLISGAEPALIATNIAPPPAAPPAIVVTTTSLEPAQQPIPIQPPAIAPVAGKPQAEGKQSSPPPKAQNPGSRQPAPPATVPLSPRRVKWTWSVSYGLGLAACAGAVIVGAVLLWPYRATILERPHRNDPVQNAPIPAPAASSSDFDKPAAEPAGDLPMTDPAQWVPLGSPLESPASPPSIGVSLKAVSRSTREAAQASPPTDSRKVLQVPVPSAKSTHPQVASPALEPAKVHQPAVSAPPLVQSANELPIPAAAAAKAAAPESKPAASQVTASGTVEIISDPYPSIRMPASSQGPASRLGTSLQIGRLITKVDPAYPAEALRQKIAGTVKLHVVIGTNGAVQSAEVMNGPALLADAARQAVEQWRYDPTMLGGTAIEVEEGTTLVFQIANSPNPSN